MHAARVESVVSAERRTGAHGASARVADPVPGAFLATSRPDIGALEAEALTRTLKRGYFGMGPEVRAFEQELENYLGPDRTVLCVSSGTAALHLAMAALEIGPGDEVLVPSLTYAASFQAVAMTGARPVACDVLRSSGLLDVDDARTRCSAATRAIMPVHYAGNLEGQAELYRFANQSGLRVIARCTSF